MTKFILVRHGEPTYDEVRPNNMVLAPLTENGKNEVLKMCENEIFENSDMLISSPYTRAIQTASIIGMKYNLIVRPEFLLHEWMVCPEYICYSSGKFIRNLKIAKKEWKQYLMNPDFVFSEETESLLSVRKRALFVLERYCKYNKVIVVSHGMLISMLFNDEVKLHTGDFVVVTSEELEKNFDFKPKKMILEK